MTSEPAYAKRFHALFARLEGRRVLLMRRDVWERMKAGHGEKMSIDVNIEYTELASLAATPFFRAAIAEPSIRADYEWTISIYREDLADAAKGGAINVDRYIVWERLPDHRDLMPMINLASTEYNDNMRRFLEAYVFIVKEPSGDDHWLPELPAHVVAVVRKREPG